MTELSLNFDTAFRAFSTSTGGACDVLVGFKPSQKERSNSVRGTWAALAGRDETQNNFALRFDGSFRCASASDCIVNNALPNLFRMRAFAPQQDCLPNPESQKGQTGHATVAGDVFDQIEQKFGH